MKWKDVWLENPDGPQLGYVLRVYVGNFNGPQVGDLKEFGWKLDSDVLGPSDGGLVGR